MERANEISHTNLPNGTARRWEQVAGRNFAQVLAGVDYALNQANSGNKPAEHRNIPALLPPP